MQFKFVDIATNAGDVRFLESYPMLRIVPKIYFERVHSFKCNETEFHWQQLTLHLVVVVTKNLIRGGMLFIVELYSKLTQIEKRESEDLLDFRSMDANVFLFDFFGEIEKEWRDNKWASEFKKSATLLKLLAMLGCSKAVLVTLRCISNTTALERVRNLFLKVVTACVLEGHLSTFQTESMPDVTSIISQLHCATKGSTVSNAHILNLITHLEQQVITISESSSDGHAKAFRALQVIR